VLRVLGEKLELREFSVFGAMAFARNGRLPDDLGQRSIVIEMQRRRVDEELAELRDDRTEPLRQIAKMCARWADDYGIIVADADPDMDLINRDRDNWRPLFAIAGVIGADWPDRIRNAAAALAPRDADSHGTVLLADIKAIFDARMGEWADRMFSEMLASELADIEGGRWAEYGKARKPITKNQLANLLSGFKIVPDTVTIGTKRLKGYYRHQFEDVWTRYLAPLGGIDPYIRNHPTAASTSAPFRNVTSKSEEAEVTFQKCEKPLSPSDGYGCTDRKGDEGTSGIDGADPDDWSFNLDDAETDHGCRQCHDRLDGTERPYSVNGSQVWLHPECRKFFEG
jgi:putative DNA primase/helicase